MLDIELYRAILGLPIPWTVLGVDLDVKGQQVTVQVHTGEGGPAAHHLRRGVGDQGAGGDPGHSASRSTKRMALAMICRRDGCSDNCVLVSSFGMPFDFHNS